MVMENCQGVLFTAITMVGMQCQVFWFTALNLPRLTMFVGIVKVVVFTALFGVGLGGVYRALGDESL